MYNQKWTFSLYRLVKCSTCNLMGMFLPIFQLFLFKLNLVQVFVSRDFWLKGRGIYNAFIPYIKKFIVLKKKKFSVKYLTNYKDNKVNCLHIKVIQLYEINKIIEQTKNWRRTLLSDSSMDNIRSNSDNALSKKVLFSFVRWLDDIQYAWLYNEG